MENGSRTQKTFAAHLQFLRRYRKKFTSLRLRSANHNQHRRTEQLTAFSRKPRLWRR